MVVRFVNAGEEVKCNAFHNRMYNAHRTMDQWRWSFVPCIFQDDVIPYAVVEDQGRIVGTQALIPIRMIDQGGIFWTAKSEGTVLDHAYRGKGLFDAMYRLMFDYADERGLAYIWGFTQAEKPLRRLGFRIPAKTTQLVFPFSGRAATELVPQSRPVGFASRAKMTGFRLGLSFAASLAALKLSLAPKKKIRSGSLKIRTLSKPPPDAGWLCEEFIRQQGGTTIYRDSDYLQWRIFRNPYFKSIFRAAYIKDRLMGWVAYSIADTGMSYLVDLMALGSEDGKLQAEDVTRQLLIEAVLGARNMGALAIRGWHFNDHSCDRMILKTAKRIGFYHVRKGHAMVIYDMKSGRRGNVGPEYADWFVNRIFTEGVLG